MPRFVRLMVVALVLVSLTAVQAGYVLRLFYDGYGPDSGNPGGFNNQTKTDPEQLRQLPGFPSGATRQYRLLDRLGSPVENESSLVPGDEGDFYGDFIRGYIEAPQTGKYKFFIRSDDQSKFFLSTDHTVQNRGANPICGVPGGGESYQPFVDDGIRSSGMISLEKGKKYYFEIYHLEHEVWDHLSVGWQLPDGTMERP